MAFADIRGWPSFQMPIADPAPFGPMSRLPPFMMDVADSTGFWGKRPQRIDEMAGVQSGRKKMRGQMDFDIGHSRVHAKYPENGTVPLYSTAEGKIVYSDVDAAAGDVVFRVDLATDETTRLGTYRDSRTESDTFEWAMSHPLLSLFHVNKILLEYNAFDPSIVGGRIDGEAVLDKIRLAGAKVTPNDKTMLFPTHDDMMGVVPQPSATVALRGYCTINSPWLYSDQQGQNLRLRLTLVDISKDDFVDVENHESTVRALKARFDKGVAGAHAFVDLAPRLENVRWQLVPYTESFMPGVPATPFSGPGLAYDQLHGYVQSDGGDAVPWKGAVLDVGYTVDRPRAQIADGRLEVYPTTLIHPRPPKSKAEGPEKRDVLQARITQPLISIAIKR